MKGKKNLKRSAPVEESNGTTEIKKPKFTHGSHRSVEGVVLTLGQGDVGQLGLGEDVMERKRPALVSLPEPIVQAEAGGMHTVCLGASGSIYTFGCNDEGALGRDTTEEGSETQPAKVDLAEKVVQVSAGDSHTAALTEDGRVFLFGSFRDNNGVIGLLEPMKKSVVPVQVPVNVPVVKIASGNDHLVMLTSDGDLYTSGCGEQGQLGRVPERFTNRGGRKGLERLLIPQCIHLKAKGCGRVVFQDVFCGAYFTFAISQEGHVYGFGLSNYHQLGTKTTSSCYAPQNLTSFKNSTKSWVGFSGGQHHTVCVDSEVSSQRGPVLLLQCLLKVKLLTSVMSHILSAEDTNWCQRSCLVGPSAWRTRPCWEAPGKERNAYSLGRAEYGRLGLGENVEEKNEPTPISNLPKVASVACGASVSYAVSKDGRVFSWGMGTNQQLGTGEEDDIWSPFEMIGKQLENKEVLTVSSGGQHTVLLVKDRS